MIRGGLLTQYFLEDGIRNGSSPSPLTPSKAARKA